MTVTYKLTPKELEDILKAYFKSKDIEVSEVVFKCENVYHDRTETSSSPKLSLIEIHTDENFRQ